MTDALIIVDYQNDFISSDGRVARRLGADKLWSSQAIAGKLQELIDKWHERGKPVLFLVSDYSLERYDEPLRSARAKNAYGDSAKPGTWGHGLYQLTPEPDEQFVVKSFFDGFYDSNLQETLVKVGAKRVYLCGINTDVCVFHTAIGAMIRGYETFVIEDATETISPHKQVFLDYLKTVVGVQLISSKDRSLSLTTSAFSGT